MTSSVRVSSRDFFPVTLFMTTVMLAFISQIEALIVAGAALSAIYAVSAYPVRSFSNNKLFLFFFFCLFFLPAFLKSYHGLSPIFYFLSTIAVFFAALATSSKPPAVMLKAFHWMYWGAVAAIAWILYVFWGYPEPFGMVIEGSSTNGIPAYLIVLQVSLSLATYLVHSRLPVLSTIFTFTVAFFGNGRGSLVIAALIVIATLLLNVIVIGREKSQWRRLFWLLLVITIVVGVIWGEELLELVTVYTKLSVGLVDGNRLEIWQQYWGKIDGLTLLFGADYAGTVIEYEYRGNPHIAFIRTHSFFGLPLTLLALVSPVFVLLFHKALTSKLVFFIFISIGAMRAVSEPIFFPTLLDLFYFNWFLMYMKHAAPSPKRSIDTLKSGACYA